MFPSVTKVLAPYSGIDDIRLRKNGHRLLNDSAVRAAIKNGVRSIPGLRIFETTGTVIR